MAARNIWYANRYLIFGVLPVVAVIIVCAVNWQRKVGQSLDSEPKTITLPTELPIPETPWGQNSPEIQKHVQDVRDRLERIKASPDAAPIALANAYGELGEIYLTYDLAAGAMACFRNAAILDSENFRWPYLQAMSHFTAVESQPAYDAMDEAMRRLASDYSAGAEHHVAARCFLGDAAMRLNRMNEARTHFNEAIRLNPNSLFAHFRRGQLASREGQSELSIQDFLDTLKLYARSGIVPPPVCVALAIEYQKLGKQDEAEKYRESAKTGPQDFVVSYANPLMSQIRGLNRSSSVLRQTAELDLSRGHYQAALDKIAEGLNGTPDSLKLRMLRVEILMQLEKIDEAIAELCEVRRLDRNGPTGRTQLCELYASRSDTQQKSLEEALSWQKDQPEELPPRLTLAAVYFQRKQYREARDILKETAAAHPEELSPQLGEVTAVCAMGEYPTAVGLYQKLRETFPENADLRHHFARFLVTCPDDLVRDSAQGLRIMRQLPETENSFDRTETLACALADSGAMEEARQLLKEVTDRLGPSVRPSLRRRLAILQRSFESNHPLREKWPFAVIDDSRFSHVP